MKRFQKLLVLTLVVCMLGGLTACSKNEGSKDASGDKTAERPRVTFMTIDFNAGSSNTGDHAAEIKSKLEEHCGVNFDIEWVLTDVVEEKITLAMSNPSTMPMIMTHNGAVTGNIVSAAKSGAFVDLNDYIWDSKKYPNLSQLNKGVADTLTVDGKLIAIPRTRDIGRYGISYRKDWAEKVGITKAPSTIEEVYDMLYKFTYNDPDGNGKDDTYGMEMTNYTGPFDIIETWFGVGNGWADVDGKLVPVHMQKEYMDALNWIRKAYQEKLMPEDWAVRTSDTWANGCKTGESGVFIDVLDGGRRIWDYFVAEATFTPSVVDPSEAASMDFIGAINGRTMATSGYNGYFTLSASTCNTPEKIEAALTLLDKLNDNDARILAEYGLEGINWEKNAEGFMVDTDLEDKTLTANYAGLNQLLAYLPRYNLNPSLEKTDRAVKQETCIAENEKNAVFNLASAYLINSATYADIGKTLDEIITQARTQYICGEIDEAGLQTAFDNWASQGGQAIIDEVNAQYKK